MHFLLGWLAAARGATKEAQTHLERAIALDPTNADSWRLLGGLYHRTGKQQELKELEARYRVQFGNAQE